MVDIEPLKARGKSSLDRLNQHHRPCRQLPNREIWPSQQAFGKSNQFVAKCDQREQSGRSGNAVKTGAAILGDMLQGHQFPIQPRRQADDPLAAKRQRHAQLMARQTDPANPQMRKRRLAPGLGRLDHREQGDSQVASPGKQAAF